MISIASGTVRGGGGVYIMFVIHAKIKILCFFRVTLQNHGVVLIFHFIIFLLEAT